MSLPSLLEQFTPGAYGIWTIAAMVATYLLREYRETRKLSSSDKQARREGYAQQVSHLTTENRNLASDLRDLREEYDRYRRLCLQETDQLRDHVVQLENRLSGVLRKIADFTVRIGRTEIPTDLADSLHKLAEEIPK